MDFGRNDIGRKIIWRSFERLLGFCDDGSGVAAHDRLSKMGAGVFSLGGDVIEYLGANGFEVVQVMDWNSSPYLKGG
jgi:hypothetical protein